MGEIAKIVVPSVIALAVILAIGADLMTKAAELKGYDTGKYHIFAICFFLGIIGYLYVIALPDRKMQDQLMEIRNVELETQNTVVSDELPDL